MALGPWRQAPVYADPTPWSPPPPPLLPSSAHAPCSLLPGAILIAVDGTVTLYDGQLAPVLEWQALAAGARCTHLAEARGVVVVLGEDASPHPVLRIFALPPASTLTPLPRPSAPSGGETAASSPLPPPAARPPPPPPQLLRALALRPPRPSPASALAFPPSAAHLAVGFGDGACLLFKHAGLALRAGGGGWPRARVVLDGGGRGDAVTGLLFREPPPPPPAVGEQRAQAKPGKEAHGPEGETFLFLATLARTLVHPLSKSKSRAAAAAPSPAGPAAAAAGAGAGAGAGGGGGGGGLSFASLPALPSLSAAPDLRTLDTQGAALGCTAPVYGYPTRGEVALAVAREDGIALYSPAGRVATLPFATHPDAAAAAVTAVVGPWNALSSLHPLPDPFAPAPAAVETHGPAARASSCVAVLTPAAAVVAPDPAGRGAPPPSAGRLTVLDLALGVVAARVTVPGGGGAWGVWPAAGAGRVAVGGGDGSVLLLTPHPAQAVLTDLLARALHPPALALAARALAPADLARAHAAYGAWRADRGEWDAAVAEWVEAGREGRGRVVRRLLDAHQLGPLTAYLAALHARGQATRDHTTLLLLCYAKTGDVGRLEAFLRSSAAAAAASSATAPSAPAAGGLEEPAFDLDTALATCRQAGHHRQALWLAERWGREEEVVRILVEDLGDGEEARAVLGRMERALAHANLLKYGKRLLAAAPEETTTLLVAHVCGLLPAPSAAGGTLAPHAVDGAKQATSQPQQQQHAPAYLGVLQRGREAVEAAAAAVLPSAAANGVAKDGRAAGAAASAAAAAAAAAEPSSSALAPASEPGGPLPSPRAFFPAFLGAPAGVFLRFLEEVARVRWAQAPVAMADGGEEAEKKAASAADPPGYDALDAADEGKDEEEQVERRAVANTILELHLTASSSAAAAAAAERAAHRRAALAILRRPDEIPYDPTHALVLCSGAGFAEGLVVLWERMGRHEDVLRFWMERENALQAAGASEGDGDAGGTGPRPSDEVLRQLDLYGPAHPYLYPLVLRFLTSSPALLARHHAALARVLGTIERERIMPPLQVVRVLARNGVTSVGEVREWLGEKIGGMRREIDSDRLLLASYRSETAAREADVRALTDESQPTVLQVSRDAATGRPLELPSVHFMCKHSYNQSSLPDAAHPACPLCAQRHALIRQVRAAHLAGRGAHDAHLAEVRESDDGFGAVAGLYSRGLLGQDEESEEEEETYITLG